MAQKQFHLDSRDRILAGHADREAATRYRHLAARNPSLKEDYLERVEEADATATRKLLSRLK